MKDELMFPEPSQSWGKITSACISIPIRSHKKKRINKKWRKRYGQNYKLIFLSNNKIDEINERVENGS